jgi:glycosyltransferase involved in cell wall biosynthesis
MPLPIYFIIPDVNAFISGGNIYNKNLIQHLKKQGIACPIKTMDEVFKNTSSIEKAYYFFDTLLLPQLPPYLLNKKAGASYFLIVHHLESLYPPKGWTSSSYFKAKEAPLLKHFDGFLTSSEFTAKYLSQNGLLQTKIIVPPALGIFPKSISIQKTPPLRALLIANLVERKGILPFLKKLINFPLHKIQNDLEIHIIGSAKMEINYAQKCLNLISQNTLLQSIIKYHGALSPQDTQQLLSKSHLFISTSFMETYGMALQEARAFSVPILALNRGNVAAHIQEGVNGFLVENMEQLIEKLALLINHPNILNDIQNQILLKEIGKTNYDWTAAAKLFMQQLDTST